MKDLPPTATLRAFEAATRHRTFSAAAQELHVTQSAVSHQLQALENQWGVSLFQRGRTLSLTPAGAALAPIVRQFMVNLETTLADLREQKGKMRLKVSTTYSFASKWLLPRLPDLTRQHPDILIDIDTNDKPINFATAESDVAIRFGGGHYTSLHSEFIFRENVFPVASPALLAQFGTPDEPRELLRYPLLTRTGADLVPKWELWFQRAGSRVSGLKESVRYPDTNMTIEAALLGQGVALVRSGHVETEISDGRLLRLFDIFFPSPAAYYFVCPKGVEFQPHIVLFRAWLLAQGRDAQASYDAGADYDK